MPNDNIYKRLIISDRLISIYADPKILYLLRFKQKINKDKYKLGLNSQSFYLD